MERLTNEQIIQKVAAGQMTAEEATLLLKTKEEKKTIYYKVSQKGCISFYGIRRMPITLYIEELEKIVKEVCASPEWSPEFDEFLTKAGDSVKRKES